MTRSEILKIAKPILFRTEMVRATLDGRKTEARILIKPQPEHAYSFLGASDEDDEAFEFMCGYIENGMCTDWTETVKMRYKPGDYLYVGETWLVSGVDGCNGVYSWDCRYKADMTEKKIETTDFDSYTAFGKKYFDRKGWIPPILMPKEATRILLRVTGTWPERLQEIGIDGIRTEGSSSAAVHAGDMEIAQKEFALLWDAAIPPKDRNKYGWNANPWVCGIEFERVVIEE